MKFVYFISVIFLFLIYSINVSQVESNEEEDGKIEKSIYSSFLKKQGSGSAGKSSGKSSGKSPGKSSGKLSGKSSSSKSDSSGTPPRFISYIAICAIVKDEVDIREWIEYHYRMGVGRFYLTDNGEKYKIVDQLPDFVKKGIVVVNETTAPAQQLPAYQRCLNNYRKYHQWMAYIDADEFLVTKKYCSIPSILKYFVFYGGLALQRILFGSSGHKKKPKGGVLKNYWECNRTPNIKSIVNTNYAITHVGNPHFFYYSDNKHAVTTEFERIYEPFNSPNQRLFKIMFVNHYHLKSFDEFTANRLKGRADHEDYNISDSFKDLKYFERYDKLCESNCPKLKMPKIRVRACTKEFIFGNASFPWQKRKDDKATTVVRGHGPVFNKLAYSKGN
jgi:hypothetical protein